MFLKTLCHPGVVYTDLSSQKTLCGTLSYLSEMLTIPLYQALPYMAFLTFLSSTDISVGHMTCSGY